MKHWQAVTAFVTGSLLLVVGLLFMDDRYQSLKAAEREKETIRLELAQSASAIQQDVSAIRLQQLQWELNDVNSRIAANKALPGDASRKIVLEARIRALVAK